MVENIGINDTINVNNVVVAPIQSAESTQPTISVRYKKIKNRYYREFLDTGLFRAFSEDDVKKVLQNITEKNRAYVEEGRALFLMMYYTGARPCEVLSVKGGDVYREGSWVCIKIRGAKRGLPRIVRLRWKLALVQELYNYCIHVFPEMFAFYDYRTTYMRHFKRKNGEVVVRKEFTDGLRKYFPRWLDGVWDGGLCPYYFRHNRFSKLAEKGASLEEMRQLKGAKTYNSIIPYLHMSRERAEKVGRKID